jgi:hypothetical protein
MAKAGSLQAVDVTQFKGINTIDDPISLDPGESPYIINMDITKTASMITRFGYELVSDLSVAGPARGVMPYYRTYDTASGDYLLIFHSDGNAYYVTNTNFTPTLIGAYGIDGNTVRGAVFDNLAIFGNGNVANNVKTWDATTLANLGGTPPAAGVFSVFGKRLFCNDTASPSTLYYSEEDDPGTGLGTNWINIDFSNGQDITSTVANNDFLQVFKENSIYGVNFSFDNNYEPTVPQMQQIIQRGGGCYATGSTQPVYGYTYYLSNKGFESYGPSTDRVVADKPLHLSTKIDPTIKNINFLYRDKINSTFFDNKYMCACPMVSSQTNDFIFVYNENIKRRFGFDNFVIYNGIPALAFAIFRDVNKKEQLYFVSHSEGKLFKFNTSFSDNGFGYERAWKSKTFQFGERTSWRYLDIEGSMTQNTTIFLDINTDSVQVSGTLSNELKIDSSNLVTASTGGTGGGGGFIGDTYVGDAYVGSGVSSGETTPMYRFKKRIYFPDTVNYGYNMWFQLRNNAEGEGWKISRYRLIYSSDPEEPSYERTN